MAITLPIIDGADRLTHSSESAFKACHRRYELSYVFGLRPAHDSTPLRLGSAFHTGLEVLKNGGDAISAVQAVREAYADATCPPWLEAEEFAVEEETAAAMVVAYQHRYAADAILEYVAVELSFDLPIVNPVTNREHPMYRNAGKIDGIARLPDGRLALIEHKCLPASCEIADYATGRNWRVDELFASGHAASVISLDADGKLTIAKAEPVRLATYRGAVGVRTKSGRALRVSENHPVLTNRGWVNATDLTGSDYLAVARTTAGMRTEELSDGETAFIGYMVGDGTAGPSGFSWCKSRGPVFDAFIRLIESLGYELGGNGDKRYRIDVSVDRVPNVVISRGSNSPLWQLMHRIGLYGCRAAEKFIPNIPISDRQAAILIGALWSTDGCIDVYREKKIGKVWLKPRIAYVSRSRRLCEEIQALLLRLGIIASVTTSSVAYKGNRVEVSTTRVITRECKKRFLSLVAEGIIPFAKYPENVADAVKALASVENSKQGRDMRGQPESEFSSSDIWWDKVVVIQRDPAEQMYDLTVPGTHTFAINGIITHNTVGEDISADADYWKKLMLDSQISRYFLAAQNLGYDIATVVYDATRKPLIKPKNITKADRANATHVGHYFGIDLHSMCPERETPAMYGARLVADMADRPDWYFRRVEIPRLECDLADFRRDQWATVKAIMACELDGYWPRSTGACTSPYTCSFLDVCRGLRGDPSEQIPGGFRRVTKFHPELTPAQPAGAEL